MKHLALILSLTLPAFAQAPPATPSTSTTSSRALVIEMTIPAPRVAVWQVFTTSEGLSTWLTPGAVVDLRPGGEWTAHFPGGSTGGGSIISYIPEQEIVISALAPDKFPTVRAARTRAAFTFTARGNETIVRLTQTGWQSGPEWDAAYEYLASGNGQLLATLHRRFVSGPLDWEKIFGPSTPKPTNKELHP